MIATAHHGDAETSCACTPGWTSYSLRLPGTMRGETPSCVLAADKRARHGKSAPGRLPPTRTPAFPRNDANATVPKRRVQLRVLTSVCAKADMPTAILAPRATSLFDCERPGTLQSQIGILARATVGPIGYQSAPAKSGPARTERINRLRFSRAGVVGFDELPARLNCQFTASPPHPYRCLIRKCLSSSFDRC